MRTLQIAPANGRTWDLVTLGEVMLRLDPGDERITTARTFRAWEGGGEYNVARGLTRCFGMRTTIVTRLVDNPIGRLIEDLMRQGGVDLSHVGWLPFDGSGISARNGLNFAERGFGVRAGQVCYDRGNTAISQVRPGEVDWDAIFGSEGARWFHTGGIFAALSATSPDVVRIAMEAAHRNGVVVSYDLNYRTTLWKGVGGQARAQEVNRSIAPFVDVMVGNEEDFTVALGFNVEDLDPALSKLDPGNFGRMIERVVTVYPNLKVVATTLRSARSASRNDWGAVCWADGRLYEAAPRADLEILDRIGGGDSFASGLIFGLLAGHDPGRAVEYGAAHGALAMTTPGSTSQATLAEVEKLMAGGSVRVAR